MVDLTEPILNTEEDCLFWISKLGLAARKVQKGDQCMHIGIGQLEVLDLEFESPRSDR